MVKLIPRGPVDAPPPTLAIDFVGADPEIGPVAPRPMPNEITL
jgi:hypothetical protein